MNFALWAFGSRRGIKNTTAAGLVIAVVIAAVASIEFFGSVSPPSRTTSFASIQVVTRAVAPNGSLVTSVNLTLGQELLLSVTVPNGTAPVSLHQIFSGHDYGELPWNVNTTHYTYVIDSGPSDTTDIGVHQVYAVVTFADGSVARSNNVTMTVAS
ncbi:MAG TPA: hypothetical protein VGS04_06725 [Nitrososphaerales archaeon]|nr:hypothetical protein [Nitrososphaerales archaeon]